MSGAETRNRPSAAAKTLQRPVNGAPTRTPAPASAMRRGLRGRILRHVVRVEPRADDRVETVPREQLDVCGAQYASLLERAAADAHAVRKHGADRIREVDSAEPHASVRARRTEVSSAAIDAAISAAVTARISSPMGA